MKISQLLFITPFIAFILGYLLISLFVYEKSIKTPALLGHSVTYALRQATEQGFSLKILAEKESTDVKPGLILAQKPVPGALIKPKQAVFITLSKSPQATTVPQFLGLPENKWQELATTESIQTKVYPVRHQAPVGMVIAQTPEFSTPGDNHQQVKLFISSGPQVQRIMPDLAGIASEEAQEFLEGYGISVSLYHEPYDSRKHASLQPGTIIAQRPLAGSWISLQKPLNVQLVVIK